MQIPDEGFPTYGALSRTAMFFGIPILPMALVLVGSTILTMIGFMTIGGSALFMMLVPIPILAALRTFSANDDKAMEIIGYEIRVFLSRKNADLFNNTTTIIGTKLGRHHNDYCRLFEADIRKAR